jgi:hypothetical protein
VAAALQRPARCGTSPFGPLSSIAMDAFAALLAKTDSPCAEVACVGLELNHPGDAPGSWNLGPPVPNKMPMLPWPENPVQIRYDRPNCSLR